MLLFLIAACSAGVVMQDMWQRTGEQIKQAFGKDFTEARDRVLPVPPSPLTPYSGVLTPLATAPLIVTWPHTRNNKQLVFRVPLDKDALVFVERPLVEDALVETPYDTRLALYNDRPAWSLVEACFKWLPRAEIHALLAADYATGVVDAAQAWETPGDDRALVHICSAFPDADAALVRRLYDVVATNNVMSCSAHVPIGGRIFEVALRYGLFALLSRANHSCVPSVRLCAPCFAYGPFHCEKGVPVYTTRAVRAGEPVTFDYAENAPAAGKRALLRKLFGFACQCEQCADLCAKLECTAHGSLWCPCRKARYCGAAHQKADWPRHKLAEHVDTTQ